jgi:glucose-6-phosphate isomerase
MFRELTKSEADRAWLRDHRLRYDVTVIPPNDLCGECVKTKGHYHPTSPAGVGYPEVYEVLAGVAHYLLQSRDHTDVVLVAAGTGDLVIIPPDYGHITINPSKKETLLMANVVSTAFTSDYGEYEALNGAAYYETSAGEFEKNPRYGSLPRLRKILSRKTPAASDLCSGPLYMRIERRESFEFLNKPERFTAEFSRLLID